MANDTPPQGTLIDACDERGNECRALSLGWRGAGERLIIKDMHTQEKRLAFEWKYPYEGTGAWRQ
ncbi:MAG: hypothetical protein DRP01_00015 [Archaeoglobales archaeon]|nr:MAG: hypothetical protein DRP01_00015 [Archaeoglobales archaeon]